MPIALAPAPIVSELVVAEELDRGAFAARMHDGPMQDLLATRYLTDLALRAVDKGADVEAVVARLEAIREAAGLALAGSRRLMGELTARGTDGVGLAGALRSTAALIAPEATVRTGDGDDAELGELPPAVAVTVHRLAGALLRASENPAPLLEVRRETDTLTLTLTLDAVVDLDDPGVAGWVTRAAALGGRVEAGDTVRAVFPLDHLTPTAHSAPEGQS